jgi:hypothetical protein
MSDNARKLVAIVPVVLVVVFALLKVLHAF